MLFLLLLSGASAYLDDAYQDLQPRPWRAWSERRVVRDRTFWTLKTGTRQTAAIIVLHGSGVPAAWMPGFASKFTSTALTQNYLLAFPQAAEGSWNAGTCCGSRVYDDASYLSDVIDNLTGLGFKSSSIFVVGFSNGGSMAVRIGCQYNAKIAGVASLHGSLEATTGTDCNSDSSQGHGECGDWDSTLSGCSYDSYKTRVLGENTEANIYSCDYTNKIVHFYSHSHDDGWDHESGQSCVAGHTHGGPYVPVSFMSSFLKDSYAQQQNTLEIQVTTSEASSTCNSYGDKLEFCLSSHGGHRWYGDPRMDAQTAAYWDGQEIMGGYSTDDFYGLFGGDYNVQNTTERLLTHFQTASEKRLSEDMFV